MVNIENQLKLISSVLRCGVANNNSDKELKKRLYNERYRMIEEQKEITRIDKKNQLMRVMYFGKRGL